MDQSSTTQIESGKEIETILSSEPKSNSNLKFFFIGVLTILIILLLCFIVLKANSKLQLSNQKEIKKMLEPTMMQPQLEKQYIALYGIELYIPKNWKLTEFNRRKGEEMSMSLYGHDCADYSIISDDSYLELQILPICEFSEGMGMGWPENAVVVKQKDSDGSFIIRYFSKSENKYIYANGYDGGNITEKTPPGLVQKTISNPPTILLKNSQYGYSLFNSLNYTGPAKKKLFYLSIADQIILSMKVINNTITVQPTPTPITANWPEKKDDSFGLSFQYPPDMEFEEEIVNGSEPFKIIHMRKKGAPSGFDGQYISISTKKNWQDAGYDAWHEPSLSNNNLMVGNNHIGIPSWFFNPPKKEEKIIDHYQSSVYFSGKNNVIYYMCQHDWDMDFYNMCIYQILSTVQVH